MATIHTSYSQLAQNSPSIRNQSAQGGADKATSVTSSKTETDSVAFSPEAQAAYAASQAETAATDPQSGGILVPPPRDDTAPPS